MKRATLLKRILILGAMLGFVFAMGRVAGWYSHRQAIVQNRRTILTELEALGAHCYYDYQLVDSESMDLADDHNLELRKHWLANTLGKDILHDVFYVTFAKINSQPKDGGLAPAAKHQADVGDQTLQLLTELKELRWLALTGSAISDQGLVALNRLPLLERLWLSQTNITDNGLQHLAKIPTLTHLWIEATPTSDRGLAVLMGLPKLQSLSLGSPLLTASGLMQLSRAGTIEHLYLDQLPVTDQVLASLAQLGNLRTLSLRQTRITDSGLQALGRLRHLSKLHLDGCQLSDNALEIASEWPQLTTLSITNTRIGDQGLQHLANCRQLQSLLVSASQCTLSGVLELTTKKLKLSLPAALKIAFDTKLDAQGNPTSINLSPVRVRDEELGMLRELSKLQWLEMRHSRLTDVGAQQLVAIGFPELRMLKLDDCALTDEGLRDLGSLPKLRDLHVSQTSVTPSAIETLRKSKPALRVYLGP